MNMNIWSRKSLWKIYILLPLSCF